jgi:hypothetical protein
VWRQLMANEDMTDITLISHPNKSFHGARDIYTAKDGWLLAVTRTPLLCAARRLREEGWPNETVVIVRDCADERPDVCGKIKDVLA